MRSSRWVPSLAQFGRHSDYQDCLRVIWENVGASGLRDEDLLLPYQRTLFRDLTSGLEEHALADLYNWWEYDWKALIERGRPNRPAKPRICLHLERTSKGNFRCEWSPERATIGETPSQAVCDWTFWYPLEHRSGGWDSRPSNELLFIHDVDHALYTVLDRRSRINPVQTLDHVLLQGIASLVDELKSRLEAHFEVRMLTDVFIEWSPDKWSWEGEDRILRWDIDDPERRENDAELCELASIDERLGFTEKQFEELWAAQMVKRTGPAPTGSVEQVAPKVAKAFRLQGLSDITAHETKRVRYLIDKHRAPKRPQRSADIIAFPSEGSINGGD
jgi:hypothetical protein